MLQNEHDAEDAFQAVFLVFLRKAASIRPRDMVANWLYGVACQTARKARAMQARRQAREKQVVEMPEPEAKIAGDDWQDLQPILDQELSRLPQKYRAAIVLCDLEGKSYKEAARQLGWPEGTLASRLSRGRSTLAKRLAHHGFAVSTAALGALLAQRAATASAPPGVLTTTIKVAHLMALGEASGIISSNVTALTEGVLKTMLLSKVTQRTVVLLLAIVFLSAGAGTLLLPAAQRGDGAKKKEKASRDTAAPVAAVAPKLSKVVTAFTYNDALADEKYTGKRFRITGVVDTIKRVDMGGYHYWLLLCADPHPTWSRSSFAFACEFGLDARKELAQLNQNQKIILEGRCERKDYAAVDRVPPMRIAMYAGQPRANETLIFRDCRIVKTFKLQPPMGGGFPGGGGGPVPPGGEGVPNLPGAPSGAPGVPGEGGGGAVPPGIDGGIPMPPGGGFPGGAPSTGGPGFPGAGGGAPGAVPAPPGCGPAPVGGAGGLPSSSGGTKKQ